MLREGGAGIDFEGVSVGSHRLGQQPCPFRAPGANALLSERVAEVVLVRKLNVKPIRCLRKNPLEALEGLLPSVALHQRVSLQEPHAE